MSLKIIRVNFLLLCLLSIFLFTSNGFSLADSGQSVSDNIPVINVSNETEFLKAIGSDRIIQLEPGIYKISDYTDITTENLNWATVYNGMQLVINNVKNLSIIGMGETPVELHIEPTAAYVMTFKNCENINLKNIEAGHFPKKGECDAGVFRFEDSNNININNTTLFGCGTVGLSLWNVEGLKFTDSVIKECSIGIISACNSKKLEFSKSQFVNNENEDLIYLYNCNNVSFINCDIENNQTGIEDNLWGNGLFSLDTCSNINLQDSRITNNNTQYFLCSRAKNMLLVQNTVFKNNRFVNGIYQDSSIEELFMEQSAKYNPDREQLMEFYKKLEYMSRKINDPLKLNQPKKRQLYLPYWKEAVAKLEVYSKNHPDKNDVESILGKYYQIGLQLNVNEAFKQAEIHLKRAISLKPELSGGDHLSLGVLYCSKLFSFSTDVTNKQPKLTVKFKQDPKVTSLAENELLKDNQIPGTANLYLFLIYYSQGKFSNAVQQADKYLTFSPDDELMKKLRGMAHSRIGKTAPGELNVYIIIEKTRRFFDYFFIQGGESVNTRSNTEPIERSQYSYSFKTGSSLINLEDEEKKVIGLLGNPMTQKVEVTGAEAFPYAGISFKTLEYEGLKLVFYQSKEGSYRISSIIIRNDKYSTLLGIKVGDSLEKLQGVYPVSQNEELYGPGKYILFDPISDFLMMVFQVDNNIITSIQISEVWD